MNKYALVLFALFISLSACDDNNKDQNTSTGEEMINNELSLLDQEILDSPNELLPYFNRAKYFAGRNMGEKALEDFNRALRIDSTNTDVLFAKGELLFGYRDFEKAFEMYKKCNLSEPENVPCLLKNAEMNVHLRQYRKALEQINSALKINDQLAKAYYIKGRIYKETGDSSLAVSSYQTAIESDPSYYDAFIEAGLLYSEARSDLAIEYFNTAMELKPNSVEAVYAQAYYLQNSGLSDTARFSQADQLYQRILEIDPGNATAHFNQGFIDLEYRQNYRAASQHFSNAIELYPDYSQAFYNRGLCHESLDERNLALADYEKALEIDPTFNGAALAKSRMLN